MSQNITPYLDKIKKAIYGEEVRDSICGAIQQCYTDAGGGEKLDIQQGAENAGAVLEVGADGRVFASQAVQSVTDEVERIAGTCGDINDVKNAINYVPVLSWRIGNVSMTTGKTGGDTEKLRVISNRFLLPAGAVVHFANARKYPYCVAVYDPEGHFLANKTVDAWSKAETYTLSEQEDYSIVVRVRENSYTPWTDALIAAFSPTASVEIKGVNANIGDRVRTVERKLETLRETTYQIKGDQDFVNSAVKGVGKPALTWSINEMNNTTGVPAADSQKMRLISNKINFPCDGEVQFSNPAKYLYSYYIYDAAGVYLPSESNYSAWLSAASLKVKTGRQLVLKVRDKNYTAWTDALIAAFSPTVTIHMEYETGLADRAAALEEKAAQLPGMRADIDQNKSSIAGILQSIANGEIGGGKTETNLLLQYKDHFFNDPENGEIAYDTGLNVEGETQNFVRSAGYHQVTEDGCVFLAKLPDTAKVSYYTYTKGADGNYTWVSVTEWMQGAAAFTPEKGTYYRVLVYDVNGIAPTDVNIILAGSLVSDLIADIAAQNAAGTEELDVPLTAAEQVELNTTKAALSGLSNANTAVIAFLTDLHIECSMSDATLQTGTSSVKIQKAITAYNKLSKEIKMDMLIFGGDYLNNNSETDKDTALHSLRVLRGFLNGACTNVPIAVLKGNHDDNTMHTDYINGAILDEQRWEVLQDIDEARTGRDADNIEKAYGYYDIPNKKIRVIYLNTCDIPQVLETVNNTINYKAQWDTGFGQAQLDFVAEHLKFTESGWQVIFFSHHPLMYDISLEAKSGVSPARGGEAMLSVIRAFKNKVSGSYSTTAQDFESEVSYDFTKNKSNTVIACVNGHMHRYGLDYIDNSIPCISTRAVSGHPSYEGHITNSSYILIDRKNRKLALVENGDGTDVTIEY